MRGLKILRRKISMQCVPVFIKEQKTEARSRITCILRQIFQQDIPLVRAIIHEPLDARIAGKVTAQGRGGRTFRRRVPKLSKNFEEILSFPQGNYEEQTEVLERSVIIINYCTVIFKASCNCNCIINSQYKYYIILLINFSSGKAIRKKMWN